jgi:hypothetical protein
MNIPDYISPVVGYRVWRWNTTGLLSVNGEPWLSGRAACGSMPGCRLQKNRRSCERPAWRSRTAALKLHLRRLRGEEN